MPPSIPSTFLTLPNVGLGGDSSFIGFTFEGFDAITSLPLKYRVAAQREYTAAMKESMRLLLIDLIPRMPVDLGGAIGSLKPEMVSPTLPWLIGQVGSDLEYMGNLEFGRAAGSTMPPINAIDVWAERKTGESGLGFVIARSIGRHGIEGHHMFEKTYDKMLPKVQEVFDAALDRVLAESI